MHAHLRLLATLLTLTATLVSLAAPGPGPAAAQAEGARLHLPLVVSPRPGVSPQVQALLPLTYYLVRDSDGTQPAPGAVVVMGFEPQGAVHIYAESADDAMAYSGTYSYDQGRLTLRFADPDFTVEAGVALDPAAESVTMPFQVFSAEPGSSTWRRERAGIAHNLRLVFNATRSGERLTIEQAYLRAFAYAEASVAGGASPAVATPGPGLADDCPRLLGVEGLGYSTIAVTYDLCDGEPFTEDVELYNWNSSHIGRELTPSPLSADPRVYLNTQPASDSEAGAGDPPNKTALIIAPFYSREDAGPLQLEELTTTLTRAGYRVVPLLDERASLIRLIEELRASPGVVLYITHGGEQGALATGQQLGSDPPQLKTNRAKLRQELQAAGYGDLITYKGPDGRRALRSMKLSLTNGLGGPATSFQAITPAFWRWLAERQGADLHRSLVYIGACNTDSTRDLRNAIGARAYFAFKGPPTQYMAGGVARYLVAGLARPTHSAEETYYNLMRVASTGQYIYAEDMLLNKLVEWRDVQSKSAEIHRLDELLRGYAWNGARAVPMRSAGWFSAGPNTGNIWWLLFTGRWGQDAQAGADGVMACWDRYWSQGEHAPAIGDPLCRNREPGSVPSENEVDYALYLLTGKHYLSFDGTPVPRWTLNDAAARLEATP